MHLRCIAPLVIGTLVITGVPITAQAQSLPQVVAPGPASTTTPVALHPVATAKAAPRRDAQGVIRDVSSTSTGPRSFLIAYKTLQGTSSSNFDVNAIESSDGGSTWSPPTRLGTTMSNEPLQLGSDGEGGAVVAWLQDDEIAAAVKPSRNGSAWTTTRVQRDPTLDPSSTVSSLSVAMLEDDSTIVGWTEAGLRDRQAWFSVIRGAAGATPATFLDSDASRITLAGDEDGVVRAFVTTSSRSSTVVTSWSAEAGRWGVPATACQCQPQSVSYGGAGLFLLDGFSGSAHVFDSSSGEAAAISHMGSVAMGGGRVFTAWWDYGPGQEEQTLKRAEISLSDGQLLGTRDVKTFSTLPEGMPPGEGYSHPGGSVAGIVVDAAGVPSIAFFFQRLTDTSIFLPKSMPQKIDRNDVVQIELYLAEGGRSAREIASQDNFVGGVPLAMSASTQGVVAWLEPMLSDASGASSRIKTVAFGEAKETSSCPRIPSDGGPVDVPATPPGAQARNAKELPVINSGVLEIIGCFTLKRPGVYINKSDGVRINGIDLFAAPGAVEFDVSGSRVRVLPGKAYQLAVGGKVFSSAEAKGPWSFQTTGAKLSFGPGVGLNATKRFLGWPIEGALEIEFKRDSRLGGTTNLTATVGVRFGKGIIVSGRDTRKRPSARLLAVADPTEVATSSPLPEALGDVGTGSPMPRSSGFSKVRDGKECTLGDSGRGLVKGPGKGRDSYVCKADTNGVFKWVKARPTKDPTVGNPCSPSYLNQVFDFGDGQRLTCAANANRKPGQSRQPVWQKAPPIETASSAEKCSKKQKGKVRYGSGDPPQLYRCIEGTWLPIKELHYVSFTGTATNKLGLTSGELFLPELTIGLVVLKDLALAYSPARTLPSGEPVPATYGFRGSVDLDVGPFVGVNIRVADGKLDAFSITGVFDPAVPLGSTGIFLSTLSAGMEKSDTSLLPDIKVMVGIGLGPRVRWLSQYTQILALEGEVTFSTGAPPQVVDVGIRREVPPGVTVAGKASFLGTPFLQGSAELQYTPLWPPTIKRIQYEVTFSVGLGLAWLGWNADLINAKAFGWYEVASGPGASALWQMQGSYTVIGSGDRAGTMLYSNRGWAMCEPDGSGHHRVDGATVDTYVTSDCDVGVAALRPR